MHSTTFSQEKISSRYWEYLVFPGDIIIVAMPGQPVEAFMVTSWAMREKPTRAFKFEQSVSLDEECSHTEEDNKIEQPPGGREMTVHGGEWKRSENCMFAVWRYTYNGFLVGLSSMLDIRVPASSTEIVLINSLNVFPLRHADSKMRALLRKRGENFQRYLNGGFVCYSAKSEEGFETASTIDYYDYHQVQGLRW
jgi:hypothetical protein